MQPNMEPQRRRRCTKTGLALIESSGQSIWRVAKPSYGPMWPLLRDAGCDVSSWGRFDVGGRHTIYGADPAEGAYAETVAWARVNLKDLTAKDLFSESDPTNRALLRALIEEDWRQRGYILPGHLPAGWRLDRCLYELRLPVQGWFVDIHDPDTINAISHAIAPDLARFGLTELDLPSIVNSEDRQITTIIAKWVHGQALDDCSLPHGIRFDSKYGCQRGRAGGGPNWQCWAIWLRQLDDGRQVEDEPTQVASCHEIKRPYYNPPLREVAKLFKLNIF